MKSCLRRRRSNLENEVSLKENATKVTVNLEMSKIFRVERLSDMSREHVDAIWYRHDDYVEIKKSITPIIRVMMRNNGRTPDESDEFTSRGLGTIPCCFLD
jgi:hypothetical protein